MNEVTESCYKCCKVEDKLIQLPLGQGYLPFCKECEKGARDDR